MNENKKNYPIYKKQKPSMCLREVLHNNHLKLDYKKNNQTINSAKKFSHIVQINQISRNHCPWHNFFRLNPKLSPVFLRIRYGDSPCTLVHFTGRSSRLVEDLRVNGGRKVWYRIRKQPVEQCRFSSFLVSVLCALFSFYTVSVFLLLHTIGLRECNLPA